TGSRVMDDPAIEIPNRAGGYSKGLFNRKYEFSRKDGPVCGDGNVFTTARDMAKWDAALAENRLVRRETLDLAFTPPKLEGDKKSSYGFGWVVQDKDGKTSVWHNGGWAGTRTMIVRSLGDGITVVVLCNDEGAKPEPVAWELLRIARG